MLQVAFPEIVRSLESLNSSVPAAESHGCLCGALCMSASYSLDEWLTEIVPEPAAAAPPQQAPLAALFEETALALRGDQMEFEPLLPGDDQSLEHRATALSEWCQGFLFGFGAVRPSGSSAQRLPASVEEVLRDLTHISQAVVDPGESGEDEERAYVEVVEYVRAGVQLIHEELLEARAALAARPTPSEDSRPH